MKGNTLSSKINIYKIFGKVGVWTFTIFFAILSATSIFTSTYINDMTTQKVLYKWDFPLASITGFALAWLFFYMISAHGSKKIKDFEKIFFFFTLVWIFFASVVIAFYGLTTPAADAMSVYIMAQSAAEGDFSFVAGTESYLSYYPHQIGMVTFLILPLKFLKFIRFPYASFHALKIMYGVIACGLVVFQYSTLKLLFRKNDDSSVICFVYLVLAGLNLPFILYTSFIYGEIPSSFMISGAIYFLVRIMTTALMCDNKRAFSKSTILNYIGLTVFSAAAVFLRKNCLVFVVALSIVLFVETFRVKKICYLGLMAIVITCSCLILPFTIKIYEGMNNERVYDGVTATSYIAMGMQEASRGPGWYNGFNFNTYQESGLNTERANEISKAAIAERVEYFKENPSYALGFYIKKYLSQWSDGTYASRQATLATFGERNTFFESLYLGKVGDIFVIYSDIYQAIIYLSAFLLFIKIILRERKAGSIFTFFVLIGAIYIFGGFLFHMLWEANSRYIFPYSIFLVPYAAVGICNYKTSYK